MIFMMLLNVIFIVMITGCGKKDKGAGAKKPTASKSAEAPKKEEGGGKSLKELESGATDEMKKDLANKKDQGADKKEKNDKKIEEAIKKGDMLPPDDNETLNDCESN